MSPSGKRDAVTAFNGTTDGTSRPRKRQRSRRSLKNQEKIPLTPVQDEKPKDPSPAFEKTEALEQLEITPQETVNGLSRKENEKALPQEHKQKRAAKQQARQERRKKIKAAPNEVTEQPPSLELQEIRSPDTAIENGTQKNSDMALQAARQTPSTSSTSQERALELSKRLKERDELLKQKRSDAASKKLAELPRQVLGKHVVETKQPSPKRVRDTRKKLKPVVKPRRERPQKAKVNKDEWSVATTRGGIFIDQDPLLTDDDQHLILPTHSEIQVYSTKTSLRVRSLRLDSKSNITSCSLSTCDRNKLYVSCSNGLISLWDWTSGTRLAEFNSGKCARQILPLQSQEADEAVLLLQDDGPGTKNLVVYLVNTSRGTFSEKQTVLRGSAFSPCVRSYGHGRVLVACVADRLLVGQSQHTEDQYLEFSYTWRELTTPGPVTSFDAQLKSGKSKTSRKVPYLDVAVGLNDGVIMHYEDILFKLIGMEKKNKTSAGDITARRLHWHRTAVNTVKWSRDGNYIISGGNETVLVIWQLDSNRRQYLPHLSTPILNLTVSAVGSAYGLRLADNSVMILSTADLLPSTNVTGLALGQPSQTSSTLLLHPRTPNRLLAAISCDSFHSKLPTFLQVYDLDSSLQLTRQALTRNMVTASNVAPSGLPVREPSVTCMDLSHDGKWLATIDQWTPHEQDLETMYVNSDDKALRGRAIETNLRIWLWNESSDNFEQVTRIDEPHKAGPNSVLGLHFNPARLELATIGADGNVRIWTAKARHRNGIAVRNNANDQLYTWTSSRAVHCNDNALSEAEPATSAALAYGEDGSVIAASWSFPIPAAHSAIKSTTHTRFVHLIDPSSGSIAFSAPSLLSAGYAKLLFNGRYLLALSSKLGIFDTILCEEVPSSLELGEAYTPPKSNAPIFLARNKYDGTVAVGVGKSERPRGYKVSVLEFNDITAGGMPADAGAGVGVSVKVVYQGQFTGVLKGLLALTSGAGFLMIDERNQTRVLRQTGSAKEALTVTRSVGGRRGAETEEVTRSLDSIFGRRPVPAVAIDGADPARGLLAAPEETTAKQMQKQMQVQPQTEMVEGGLDAVLRFPSSAMAPSPAELFQRVVSVMARG
ncbi:hypothetical protein A1O7_02500 [Cladophialophora yegresii CBS 114405]|uniref:Uncharacterized protein n=1 Tax=Cladophialophora yegresii CBS 114405 TaxID=1182544 RepID=W9W1W4_9EURO|nr:uncharacterized protein A1O7_02500 [Cladophialophora yegresii CBS 114405]EXJ62067.1 hypothetical protein A1O7_02500 [Cladophialophora yegresii CBS 114405]